MQYPHNITEEQAEYIRKKYPTDVDTDKMAKEFGLRPSQLRAIARALGVSKTPETVSLIHRTNVNRFVRAYKYNDRPK